MKIRTSELTGPTLDWAVAMAEGENAETFRLYYANSGYDQLPPEFHYSTEWEQGGPIIEREGLLVRPSFTDERDKWTSILWEPKAVFESGPTPLIAAMRCYVASKLGYEVDIPKELQC